MAIEIPDLEQVKKILGLEPLEGEGGYFHRIYTGEASPVGEELPSTSIYYVITPDSFSTLHKLKHDEIWYFCMGDPSEQLLLHPDGRSAVLTMGTDLLQGQQLSSIVPAGVWQGTRLLPGGNYAVFGVTMPNGYSAEIYEQGDQAVLAEQYPAMKEIIEAFQG
ncbi:MAG: cupin domain-containing protein [Spirochaetales bacterium]|nr:cupin domain-containing protein [Spirochaetales bacterium]